MGIEMTSEQKKEKILACIKACGYAAMDCYLKEGKELLRAGMVKISKKYTSCGNSRLVWVAA
jgi:hypothetical protein